MVKPQPQITRSVLICILFFFFWAQVVISIIVINNVRRRPFKLFYSGQAALLTASLPEAAVPRDCVAGLFGPADFEVSWLKALRFPAQFSSDKPREALHIPNPWLPFSFLFTLPSHRGLCVGHQSWSISTALQWLAFLSVRALIKGYLPRGLHTLIKNHSTPSFWHSMVVLNPFALFSS